MTRVGAGIWRSVQSIGRRSAFALIVSCAAESAFGQAPQVPQHPMEARGLQPDRGYVTLLPWERIDTFSGAVVLTVGDLVLPGNAGFDLRFERTFMAAGSGGSGWVIGAWPDRIWHSQEINPIVLSGDQAQHHTFLAGPGVYLTKDLWRYTPAERKLEMPDGVVCYYWYGDTDRHLSRVQDRFGNIIDFAYAGEGERARLQRLVQFVGDRSREVTFTYYSDGRTSSTGGRS